MTITKNLQRSLYLVLAVIALGNGHWAYASSVVYEDVDIAEGYWGRGGNRGRGHSLNVITLDHTGSYELSLTDFEFPKAFKKITVGIMGSHRPLARLDGPGSISFDADAGDYWLGLAYKTDRHWGLGMYGIEIRHLESVPVGTSPVPLPGAALLMLSGLAGLVSITGKRTRRAS